MRSVRIVPQAILVILVLGAACSEDNPSDTGNLCRTGTFQLNPNNGMPYTVSQDFRFLCRDSALDPDVQFIYDDCPTESDGFFWFYGGGLNVTFQANLGELVFTGSVVREFGSGVGPFAEGIYERKSGGTTVEIGQFSFNEGDMELPGTVECSPRSVSAAGDGPVDDD